MTIAYENLSQCVQVSFICVSQNSLTILSNLILFLEVLVLKFKIRGGGDWETASVVCISFCILEGL